MSHTSAEDPSAREQMAAAQAGTLVGAPRRYRKTPLMIEAVQWTGKNLDAVTEFCPVAKKTGDELWVSTPEGDIACPVGDWILKTQDVFRVNKDAVFRTAYEVD